MGGLIQTKGTQYLANFFNQRFSSTGGSLTTLRGITIGGAVPPSLISDFAKPFGVSSLFYLSEKYRGQWTDGSDVLYPACSISGVTSVAGNLNQLTFPGNVPAFIVNAINTGAPTLQVYNESRPGSINSGITVQASVSATTIRLSTAVNSAIQASDWLVFIDTNQANLLKRWKYYLQYDLLNKNHSEIQAAVHQVLADLSFDHAIFQAIESTSQNVDRAIEFDAAASNYASLGVKYMHVVLQTARTTSPTPLDPQH
jgi:hypothetical protein